MSVELNQKKKHLGELELFLKSDVHRLYVEARKTEVSDLEQRILAVAPTNQENIASLLFLHGELGSQKEMIKTFEDALVTLKQRVSEMADREIEQRANTKQ